MPTEQVKARHIYELSVLVFHGGFRALPGSREIEPA